MTRISTFSLCLFHGCSTESPLEGFTRCTLAVKTVRHIGQTCTVPGTSRTVGVDSHASSIDFQEHCSLQSVQRCAISTWQSCGTCITEQGQALQSIYRKDIKILQNRPEVKATLDVGILLLSSYFFSLAPFLDHVLEQSSCFLVPFSFLGFWLRYLSLNPFPVS